jgi:hypothetical protein
LSEKRVRKGRIGFDRRFGHPRIFSRPGKNSLSLKQLPGPGKDPGVAFTQAETMIMAG